MIELYTGTEIVGTAEWSMTTDTAGPDAFVVLTLKL